MISIPALNFISLGDTTGFAPVPSKWEKNVETRYPDAIGGTQAPYRYYDSKRSEECLKNAGRVLEWAEKRTQ